MAERRGPDGAVLPQGVYWKHGAYYKVVRGVWHRLGSDPHSTSYIACVPERLSEHRRLVLAYTKKVLTRARNNAKGRRGIAFELTPECARRMLDECGWRCAVTGADFSFDVVNGAKPYAPSIDRRDCRQGYTADNCRVVCVAANYAMNIWGEEVLWRLFSKKPRKMLDSVGQLDSVET